MPIPYKSQSYLKTENEIFKVKHNDVQKIP